MLNRRSAIIGGLAAGAISLNPASVLANNQKARIIVSLADNTHQGIVPVPAFLGNGQDPKSNLYWGAMYGLKTFLKRQSDWTVQSVSSETPQILDKIKLTYKNNPIEISAEAWDGAHQKDALKSYFRDITEGSSNLIMYVGHNPLMDFMHVGPIAPNEVIERNKQLHRKSAVIACQSHRFFTDKLNALGMSPYVMTAGNMAPEAYVVEAILRAWIGDQSAQVARQYAAQAYSKYQKIPLRNSNWLFGV